jgi:hypothetical protein
VTEKRYGRSIVGHVDTLILTLSESPLKKLAVENLRCLGRPKLRAIKRLDNASISSHAFYGFHDGVTENCGSACTSFLAQRCKIFRRKRPRSIMNGHESALWRQGGESIDYAVLASSATRNNRDFARAQGAFNSARPV